MIARVRLWFVALAFLGLFAAQVFSADALRWYTERGGPTGGLGIVNLPLAAKTNLVVQTGLAREGYNMLDVERGLVLNLPSDMTGTVVAVTTIGGLTVSSTTIQGSLSLSGKDLLALRNNGVTSFELIMVDSESRSLRCLIQLKDSERSFKVLIW